MRYSQSTRRNFLKKTAAISAGIISAPAIIPSTALGRDGALPPSERITMGLIGCGGHGVKFNLDRMFSNQDQQVVAVCDVQSKHLARGEQKVNEHYSKKLGRDYRCATYGDFRNLINSKQVDAVAVCTPDHWHVIPSLMALKAGKHVICEKPISLTVDEGRILSDVAAESNLVFQTASQNRSIEAYIRLVELVKAGVFGKIKKVKILLPPGNRHRAVLKPKITPVPPHLDYEMWQGQAPEMPYCASRVHGSFRWNLAYSGGVITDWGAHMIDLAHWATDNERTGPTEVEGKGEFPLRDAVWNTANTFKCYYRYASGPED